MVLFFSFSKNGTPLVCEKWLILFTKLVLRRRPSIQPAKLVLFFDMSKFLGHKI